MADVLNLAAIISAIGAGLGCASVGRAHALRARARPAARQRRPAVVSSTGAPGGGLAFVMALDLAILVVFGVAKAKPIERLLLLRHDRHAQPAGHVRADQRGRDPLPRRPRVAAELVLPLAGIAVAGYVLYHNV